MDLSGVVKGRQDGWVPISIGNVLPIGCKENHRELVKHGFKHYKSRTFSYHNDITERFFKIFATKPRDYPLEKITAEILSTELDPSIKIIFDTYSLKFNGVLRIDCYLAKRIEEKNIGDGVALWRIFWHFKKLKLLIKKITKILRAHDKILRPDLPPTWILPNRLRPFIRFIKFVSKPVPELNQIQLNIPGFEQFTEEQFQIMLRLYKAICRCYKPTPQKKLGRPRNSDGGKTKKHWSKTYAHLSDEEKSIMEAIEARSEEVAAIEKKIASNRELIARLIESQERLIRIEKAKTP